MPNAKTHITDKQLSQLVQTSLLEERQKKELLVLIEIMTTEERAELINIINQASNTAEKMEEEKEGKIKQLNQEYSQKTSELSRNETKYVREEFEKFDNEQSDNNFSQIENAGNAGIHPQTDTSVRDTHTYTQRHPIRNTILIILTLLITAGAILYGLYYLRII